MNENKLSNIAKRDLINLSFRFDDLYDYFEFNETEAAKYYLQFILNRDAFDNRLRQPIIIKNENGEEILTPMSYDIYQLETDAIIEMLDGSFDFDGSIQFKEREDPLRLRVKVGEFKILEVWAFDMMDNLEVPIINDDKWVVGMTAKKVKAGPQTYNSVYRFTYGGSI